MKRTMNIQYKLPRSFMFLLLAGSLAASCGEVSTSDQETSIEQVTPEDSTGATGNVALTFASDTSATTALGLGIDLGGGIQITAAKFNLAAIKIKAQKDQTPAEVDLEKKETEAEKIDFNEVDTVIEATSLLGEEKKGQARREKLAKEKTKFAEKEEKSLKGHKERDKAVKFSGPYVYDAVLGQLESSTGTASLPDGSYRRLEFKLRRNWSVAETDPLFGNTFYIDGTFTQGEKSTRFLIDHHAAMNFRLRGTGTVGVDANATSSLSVMFDLAKWFEGIDLSTATVDSESSMIYINHTSNKEILKLIRQNIKKHTKFGKDKDGDEKLSEDETAGQGEAETGDDISGS